MAEKVVPTESQFGKEWILFGQDHGAKTEDLQSFEALGIPDVSVQRGFSIGASYFRDYLAINGFTPETPDNKLQLVKAKIPPSLRDVQKAVLGLIPVGTPFFVRSSAIGEHGGTGIYDSDIMVRTGDNKTDLNQLTRITKMIYSGYNSENAH